MPFLNSISYSLLQTNGTSSEAINFASFHPWLIISLFAVCIIFIVLSVKLPLWIPNSYFWKQFWFKIRKNWKRLQEGKEADEEVDKEPPKFTKIHLPLDMNTVPIICIIILLSVGTLNFDAMIMKGILGRGNAIQPITVTVLFMAICYICISLDATGLFEYLARLMVLKYHYSGYLLFIANAIFAAVLTVFTNNDIVILAMTPIMCYMGQSCKNFDPIPYTIAQFFLANIFSMTLEIGNPTNIIVAEANRINFLTYSAWMVIPTLGAGITCFAILYFVFYKRIPKKIEILDSIEMNTISENDESNDPETVDAAKKEDETQQIGVEPKVGLTENPLKLLVDKPGALIKTFGMLIFLITLASCSFIKINGETIPTWIVCLSFCILYMIYDIIKDFKSTFSNKWKFKDYYNNSIFLNVLSRCPWSIVPFVIGMFIFVQMMKEYGWISFTAKYLSRFINLLAGNNENDTLFGRLRAVAAATFVMSYVTSFACNVLNNQPMTILFTYLLQDANFALNVGHARTNQIMRQASMFALIIGSNLGGNITIIGALAGIMWKNILVKFGIDNTKLSYLKFAMYGVSITPIVLIPPSLIMVIEKLIMWHK